MSGLLAALVGVGIALGAPAPTSGDAPPADVVAWFADDASAAVTASLSADSTLRDAVPSGSEITTGAPVPQLTVDVPAYDVREQKVLGSTAYADVVSSSGTYCARIWADGAPVDAVVCADDTPSGVVPSAVSQVKFLPDVVDLPAAGIYWSGGMYGLDPSGFVPLDERARFDAAADSVPVDVLVLAMARRNAERAAIEAVEGQLAGGPMSLMSPAPDEIGPWQESLSKALAESPGSGSDGVPVWVAVAGVTALVLAAAGALVLGRRRRRTYGPREEDPAAHVGPAGSRAAR